VDTGEVRIAIMHKKGMMGILKGIEDILKKVGQR
jgi:hypothetical protein